MADLSIILVNYHGAHDTVDCLRSLRASTYTSYDTYIVDNSPEDKLEQLLADECAGITLLQNQANVGFARGNNLAIRQALDRGSRFILLLNNDTLVESKALSFLIDRLETDRTIGIVGPKILYHEPAHRLWYAGGGSDPASGSAWHIGIGEIDNGQYDTAGATDYVTGCCLLARREVFETCGLLDESFFAYLEDVDLCQRARTAGFGIAFEPAARIWHKVSRTSAWDSPVYLYFNSRNRFLMVRKYTAGLRTVQRVPGLVMYSARQLVRLLFKHRDFAGAHAVWLGITDGITGETGHHGEGSLYKLRQRARPR